MTSNVLLWEDVLKNYSTVGGGGTRLRPEIIKGFNQKLIHIVQIFIDCGDCMGVLMFNIDSVEDEVKDMIAKNKIFADAVKILRSVK